MAPGLSWAVPFVWLCVCVVHGRISVRPRIFDLQEQTIYRDRYNRMRGIEPVTLTVQGLHFVDSSKYSCLWSTPWEDRRSITSRIVDGKLLCTVNNTHPLAKWHLAGFWPLVNWGQEKTMGGVGRLTVVRAGANKKWYREYANVFETNIFFTRFSEMTRGEPPSVTAEKQRLANKFQDYIYHRQNPSDCQKASIVFLGHLEPTGMGSQLMMMSRHLFEVIHNESVLIPVFNWNYAEGLRPPVWQQIFKPLSRCETILLNKGVRPPGFHHPHISKFMTKAKFHDFQSGPPPDWDKVSPCPCPPRRRVFAWHTPGALLLHRVPALAPVLPSAREAPEGDQSPFLQRTQHKTKATPPPPLVHPPSRGGNRHLAPEQ